MPNHNRITADGNNRVTADSNNRVTPVLIILSASGTVVQLSADVASRAADAGVASRSAG